MESEVHKYCQGIPIYTKQAIADITDFFVDS